MYRTATAFLKIEAQLFELDITPASTHHDYRELFYPGAHPNTIPPQRVCQFRED
jgi:hypothetical protein